MPGPLPKSKPFLTSFAEPSGDSIIHNLPIQIFQAMARSIEPLVIECFADNLDTRYSIFIIPFVSILLGRVDPVYALMLFCVGAKGLALIRWVWNGILLQCEHCRMGSLGYSISSGRGDGSSLSEVCGKVTTSGIKHRVLEVSNGPTILSWESCFNCPKTRPHVLCCAGARASSRASLQCQAIRSGHPWCLGWWEVRQLSIGMVFWIEFMVIACHRIEIYNAITTWNRKSKDPNKRLNSRFLSAGLLRAWLQNVAETFFTRCRSKLRCGARKPKWIQLGAPLKVQKNNCETLTPASAKGTHWYLQRNM